MNAQLHVQCILQQESRQRAMKGNITFSACVGLRYIEEAPTTVCKPTSIDHHAHRWNGVRAVQ